MIPGLAEKSYSSRIRPPAFQGLEHDQNGFPNAAFPVIFPIEIPDDAAHFELDRIGFLQYTRSVLKEASAHDDTDGIAHKR